MVLYKFSSTNNPQKAKMLDVGGDNAASVTMNLLDFLVDYSLSLIIFFNLVRFWEYSAPGY